MSRKFTQQFADPKGILIQGLDGNGLLAEGTAVPADTTAGYAPGCIFEKRAGTIGAQLYINEGSATSCLFHVIALGGLDLSTLVATATELNTLHTQNMTNSPGAGISGASGNIYKTSVQKNGLVTTSRIFINMLNLQSSTTDADIIGRSTTPAYITLLTAQQGTTIFAVTMQCLELPATGVTDIDIYSATEGTGVFDDAISGLTETQIISSAGAWTAGRSIAGVAVPLNTEYLYFTNGTSGTVGTYSAGKFLITLYGY